jgi:YidC/Oxa1 family membrane protein insertase
MEKRALLAFALSMAIFIIWYSIMPSQKPEEEKTAPQTAEPVQTEPVEGPAPQAPAVDRPETPAPAAGQTAAPLQKPPEPAAAGPLREITVKTSLYTAVFTERGGRLTSLTLNRFRTTPEEGSPPKELVHVAGDNDYPLGLYFKQGAGPDLRFAPFTTEADDVILTPAGGQTTLKMVYRGQDGFEVHRLYTFSDQSYLIDMQVKLVNRSNQTIDDNLVVELKSLPLTDKIRYAGFGAYINDELIEEKPDDLAEELDDLKSEGYQVSWAGYEDQYFMAVLLPENQEWTRLTGGAYPDDTGIELSFINPPLTMTPQTQKAYEYRLFYGPKKYNVLKDAPNHLERAIYFGWFDILSKPLLIFMNWLYGFVGNYGVVIIIVTLIIKAIFWPLTAKSYKSMKSMQKLQPKIMKLREKYKDDRQAMNAEMMQLYRTYKVNPMGGCLPMIIQIPVFIALYRLLDYSLELRHEPFILWINDLAAPDRLFRFGVDIPLMEPPAGIPVLTLLMGASMLLQQKMTPTPGDPTQAKIMMFLPVFFTFIFINFPSGLVLYWLVNNLLSIGQQTLINKRPD